MIKIGKGTDVYETAKIVRRGKSWMASINIGRNCLVGDYVFVAVKKLKMSDGSQLGPHAIISGGGEAVLNRFSVVGFGAQLITGTDSTRAKYMCEAAPPSERHVIRGRITLGEGSYIGAGAIICVSERSPSIVIGDYSAVGALTYVDKSVPPRTIIYSKPTVVKKRRRFS